MKIGLLIAVEIDSLLKSRLSYVKTDHVGKFDAYIYEINGNQITAIQSGCGQIKAAAAAEILISVYHVDFIINFGIVGALTEKIGLQQVCLVDRVVDYTFDTSEADGCEVGRHLEYPSIHLKTNEKLIEKALEVVPSLVRVSCASGSKFVASPEEKLRIHQDFECDIIDMEAAGILLTADMHDIGVLFIKGISDSLHGGKEEFLAMYRKSSDVCLQIVMQLLEQKLFKVFPGLV